MLISPIFIEPEIFSGSFNNSSEIYGTSTHEEKPEHAYSPPKAPRFETGVDLAKIAQVTLILAVFALI